MENTNIIFIFKLQGLSNSLKKAQFWQSLLSSLLFQKYHGTLTPKVGKQFESVETHFFMLVGICLSWDIIKAHSPFHALALNASLRPDNKFIYKYLWFMIS
jgi:hypothetical protein